MKRGIAISSIALCLLVSTHKTEAVVCTDPGSMMQQLQQYALDITQWSQEYGMMKLEQELQSQLAQYGIQSDRELSSNDIARTTQVDTDLHNKRLEADLAPVQQACDIIAASEAVSKANVNVRKIAMDGASAYVNDKTKVYTPKQYKERREVKAGNIFQRTGGSDAALRGDVFLGLSGNTLNEEQAQAMDDFITLVSGDLESSIPINKPDSNSTQSHKARYAQYIKELSVNSVVVASLNGVKAEMMPSAKNSKGEDVSRLELIDEFVGGRFGGSESSEFISLVTNTHPQKSADPHKYLTTEAQALRHLTTLEGAGRYLDALQYRQGMRLEMLEAVQTKLLLEINEKLSNPK